MVYVIPYDAVVSRAQYTMGGTDVRKWFPDDQLSLYGRIANPVIAGDIITFYIAVSKDEYITGTGSVRCVFRNVVEVHDHFEQCVHLENVKVSPGTTTKVPDVPVLTF